MRAIGDLASFMLSSRFQANLRNTALSVAQEATTGLAADKARHLGGLNLEMSLLERKTILLEQHQRGIIEAGLFASSTQVILGRIQDQTTQLSQNLSLASQLTEVSALKAISDEAAAAFVDTINAINSKFAGRFILSGSATKSQPLPNGNTILEMLRSEISGASSINDVIIALDAWFDAPSGGFNTLAYKGSNTGYARLPLSEQDTAIFRLRADDEVFRNMLKAVSKSALATDPLLNLTPEDQQTLLSQSHVDIISLDKQLTKERANLGLTEAVVEEARLSTESELARLKLDRLTMIGVDQFESASKFEAGQKQLELFYRIAARQGQTSLAEYLR
jgi:flagellar hook-associated protein 3 FlgL